VQDSTPPAPSPVPTPTPVQPSGPPAGCQQGEAAITTWNQTAGPAWPTREAAAVQAESGIEAVINSGPSGMVYSALAALSNDFENLHTTTMSQSSTGYDAVVTKIGTDSQALQTDCNTG
jgi:hypothetical protein